MKQILSLLCIAIIVCTSCAKPKSFLYRDIKNIRLGNISSGKANVSMDLICFNPNSYGVSLKKVDCDIYLDSNYAGKFSLDTLMYIPATAEFTLPTHLNVDTKNILNNGLSMLFNRDREYLIGAKGTARVGKAGVYVTVPFVYKAKQKLNFF